MKKVIGVSRIFFIAIFCFLTNGVTYAQGLSPSEQLYLKNISNNIVSSQGHPERVDSLLWEMANYTKSFYDETKRDEAASFYWAEYAMNSPRYDNKVYDTSARNELIKLSESCIGTYRMYYTKGVWKEYRFDILLLRELVYLYAWNRNYPLSLSALREYEDEVLHKDSKSTWELLDIYSLYSDFYNNMGLYEKEAEMNQLIRDEYGKNGCQNVYDSLKLLSAIHGLIDYSVRRNEIEKVFDLVDEYEKYFFQIDFFLKPKGEYAGVLEQLALLSLNYSKKYAKECIEKEIEYLNKENLDEITCPNCFSGLKSIQLEYYKSLKDWKMIYQTIERDSNFMNSHYGLFLEACLNLGKKEECLKTIDFALKDLSLEFEGLKEFHPVLRVQRIKKITLSRNYRNIRQTLFWFPDDSNFVKRYFEFLVKFNSIEIGLNDDYENTLKIIKSDNLSNKIYHNLKGHESVLELSRISKIETVKTFNGVSNGISFRLTNDSFPIIREILPYTLAFESGLKISDIIISINGKNTKGKSTEEVVKMFNTVEVGNRNKVGVIRKGIDKEQYYYSRRDSTFTYRDSIVSKYAFYSLTQDSGKNYHYTLKSAKNVDDLYNSEYVKEKTARLPQELVPIFKKLENSKTVYFSTDGVFNKINTETLTIKDDKGMPHYLGDLYDIRLICSARDLLIPDNGSNPQNAIALFGYPDYTLTKNEQAEIVKSIVVDSTLLTNSRGDGGITGSYVFKSLPATKHEVEDIGANLKQRGWDVQIYTGSKALEEQIKSIRSPRILHIATHGFFAPDIQPDKQTRFMGMDSKNVMENPMLRSGLAFAGAETTRTDSIHTRVDGMDDGILTAEEVQYLHLDSTELVVLSACETGLGEIVNGEGVYGLQRAFRAAGAKSVLMSLWKVDDLATETLMKNFYKHWLDDGMDKHDALWQAKLDLRNDKAHPEWAKPFYWGAFVMVGQ